MSDSVLRCPNCGTTQASPGECEACHDADVRWFCPNHTPGRWLDGAVCAECASRPKREPPRPRPTTPPRNVSRGAPPPEPPRRDVERELLEALLGGGRRRPDPSEPEFAEEIDASPRWRGEPPVGRGTPTPWGREGVPGVRLPRVPFLGCVGQLIKLVIVLLILFALATCWFFSGSGIVIGDGTNAADEPAVAQVAPGAPERPPRAAGDDASR